MEGKGGQENEVGANATKLSRKYHSKVHFLYNEYKPMKYPHFETEWHFHGKQCMTYLPQAASFVEALLTGTQEESMTAELFIL